MSINRSKLIITGFILILVLAVIKLLLSVFSPDSQTSSPQLNSPYGIISTEKTSVSYVGNNVVIPETLPKFSLNVPTLEQFAENLAQLLNMSKPEDSTKLWLTAGGGESLNLISQKNYVVYSLFDPKQAEGIGIDSDGAKEAASNFLSKLGYDTNAFSIEVNPEYLGADYEIEIVEQNKAAYALFTFIPQVQGYPLLYNNQASQALQVWVRNDYRVTKATLAPLPTITGVASQEKSVGFDLLLKRVKQGEGAVVRLNNYERYDEVSLDEFSRVEFNSARIEYRANTADGKAYPFVAFRGKAEGAEAIYDIELLISAI